jgi:hypothetical protein
MQPEYEAAQIGVFGRCAPPSCAAAGLALDAFDTCVDVFSNSYWQLYVANLLPTGHIAALFATWFPDELRSMHARHGHGVPLRIDSPAM